MANVPFASRTPTAVCFTPGAVITGLKVTKPDWLVQRLQSVGSRSITNVVDAHHYMLLGFGQTMPPSISIRSRMIPSWSERPAVRSDQDTRRSGQDSSSWRGVIGDGARAGIAGIIGGSGSEVSDSTTEIFPRGLRVHSSPHSRQRRKLGISTDASIASSVR